MKELNVKQKLLNARKEILNTKVKKEGKNKFSNYDYFTPSQITALCTKACINNGLLTKFSIEKIEDSYIGKLIIESVESNEVVEFTIPTAMPDIKATNITQKLGGMVTYTQRYLEMVAFGITDNNLDLDSQDNRVEKEVKKPKLDDKRFQSALTKIKEKSYKVEDLIKTFDLTIEQQNQLKNLK